MTDLEPQASRGPKRPLQMLFMGDVDLDAWVERRRLEEGLRRRGKPLSRSEFLYEIVAGAMAQDLQGVAS